MKSTSQPKERPILFSSEMIRAILKKRKTQTRRVVVPTQSTPRVPPLTMQPWVINGELQLDDNDLPCWYGEHPSYLGDGKWFSCPYGKAGDRIWVRESAYYDYSDKVPRVKPTDFDEKALYYRADGECCEQIAECACAEAGKPKWTSSIFLPRWASRITLEIISVDVQRVQSISEEDARVEGVADRAAYAALWDKLNAKRGFSWESNPWVWIIEFRMVSNGQPR